MGTTEQTSSVTIQVEHEFIATHRVPGDPANAHDHGHLWLAVVEVGGPLDDVGWIMDFKDLLAIVSELLPPNADLNAVFGQEDATVECLAANIARAVDLRLPVDRKVVRVRLREAHGCYSTWSRGA